MRVNKKLTAGIGGTALVSLAACSSTHTVYVPSSSPAANAPSEAPAPAQSSSTPSYRVTCRMITGAPGSGDPTGANLARRTVTPEITITNTGKTSLDLIQLSGGAVQWNINFLDSSGHVVSDETNDSSLSAGGDGVMGPGKSLVFSELANPISGEMNDDMYGQGVSSCSASFVENGY